MAALVESLGDVREDVVGEFGRRMHVDDPSDGEEDAGEQLIRNVLTPQDVG